MPIVRPKWSDLSPLDQRSLQDEESWDMYWDEAEKLAERLKKELSEEEFRAWVEAMGIEWVDD